MLYILHNDRLKIRGLYFFVMTKKQHIPEEEQNIPTSSTLFPLSDTDHDDPGDYENIVTQIRRPPRLLLTLLGDYWWQRGDQLPSAALVALLTEFGVSDTAARAALS